MSSAIREYLEDPFLRLLYEDISAAGPIRPIQMDLTHACNIRCQGCYFFSEELDRHKAPKEEAVFDHFLAQEKARGTNFVTVLGGEPSLMPGRLKKVYDSFWMLVVTNGLRRIPTEGFEGMPIVISVWGDHETDTRLRGSGKVDVFARGLANYRDDPRALWYYTTTPGNVHEIESVVEQIVANGNYAGFNFYGDISGQGGDLDHSRGFGAVRDEIDRMIDRYPDRILATSYITRVIASGRLFGDRWGFDVCCTLSNDIPKNQERFRNGKAYLPHFRAYNPDLVTTRACCRSGSWDCEHCFDTWAHLSWIMTNVDRHLGSRQDFVNWLTTTYVFHLTGRIVDFEDRRRLLPEIHRRLRAVREDAPPAPGLTSQEVADLVSEVL
jgi:hypothetical protein